MYLLLCKIDFLSYLMSLELCHSQPNCECPQDRWCAFSASDWLNSDGWPAHPSPLSLLLYPEKFLHWLIWS